VFFVPVGARGVFSLINETFSLTAEAKKNLKEFFINFEIKKNFFFLSLLCAEAPEVKAFSFGSQFSSRPSLVPSVTVVLLKFSDRWERVRAVTHKGHGSG
jgi:hypothetical protein